MKKFLLFLIFLISAVTISWAQEEDQAHREKIYREVQEFKMQYLAKEMDLSDEQKEKFFELYEQMTQEKQEIYRDAYQLNKNLKKDKDATDEDYRQASEALAQANTQWNEVEKQYNEKFSEFLSQKQLFKLREAENNFKARLDEMRHSRKKDHKKKKDKK